MHIRVSMRTGRSFSFYAMALIPAAFLACGGRTGGAELSMATTGSVIKVGIEADRPIGKIGYLYNVGYNGWGDITYPGMIKAFDDIGIKFCRIRVDLHHLCGERPGDYRWDYLAPEDEKMPLVQRVRKVIQNGWTPILAFSFHGTDSDKPKWFVGDSGDSNRNSWTRYNVDGSRAASGYGNQLDATTRIAKDVTAYFALQGLNGLSWETIYEMDGGDPLVEIHHAVAKGIREADASATIIGPATWPGWSAEEAFVKPYLKKYGPDLIDMVSVHWYASCDHGFWKLRDGLKEGKRIMTMADRDLMSYLMGETPGYGTQTRSLDRLLKSKALNPGGKKIGIIFTEADLNATSYYKRNPENPKWPNYSAGADCWQNTNYFGGVWWASVLCHVASSGVEADVCKFNTRDFYGIQEVVPPGGVYRFPVWFAMKLLRDSGGLRAGRQMLQASITGSGTSGVEAFATGNPQNVRIILINKSFDSQVADIAVTGLDGGSWEETSYVFDQSRVARFQGRKPGDKNDGKFEGFPKDDSSSEQSLKPIATAAFSRKDGSVSMSAVKCPPVSFVILSLSPAKCTLTR